MAKQKMKKEKSKNTCESDCDCGCGSEGKGCCGCGKTKPTGGCAIYGLGMIGSAIYFISHTSGFWNVVLAILKAIVWPVFLTMKLFGL